MGGVDDDESLTGTEPAERKKFLRMLLFFIRQKDAGSFPVPCDVEGTQKGDLGLGGITVFWFDKNIIEVF